MKVAVGDLVSADATAVDKKSALMYFGPAGAQGKKLSGCVTGTSGAGRGVRYLVRWTDDRFPPSEHTARMLTVTTKVVDVPEVPAPAEGEAVTPVHSDPAPPEATAPEPTAPEVAPSTNNKLLNAHFAE